MHLFQISLSQPDAVATINQRMNDGRAVRVPVRLRSIELEIIDASYMALAKHTQYFGEYLQCIRHMNSIQSVTDQVQFINFSKSDMENLIQGFELTKGSRPDEWTRCISFFNQINAPKEIGLDPVSSVQSIENEKKDLSKIEF